MLDSGGNIAKEVGAPLTPEQKAEQIVENRRRKQLEDSSREQRRRDQALLDTYATPEDIDFAQQKAEADVNFAILATIARIDAARTKRKKFEDEAEFYKKKTLPPSLDQDLRALDHEIKLQQDLLSMKRRDFEAIKAKYDADRRRYFELTRKAPATPVGNPPPIRQLASQLLLQKVVNLLRIGLAFGCLHDLPHQGVKRLLLARLEFRYIGWIGCQHFIDQRLNGAAIGDLLQPLLVDDLISSRTITIPQGIEYFLRDVVGDRVIGNTLYQTGKLRG